MSRLLEIDGYTIEKEIGTGAMATVYLAEQTSLSRQVALKVMSPSLASNDTFARRFIQEGKTIARLEQNNIVNIFDIGTSETCCYIAMEYLSGGTLKDRMQNEMYLNEALRIIRQIAQALSYAHQHHFVHRDIKPLNVMYRADGTVVLTDFGIAKEIAAATTGLTATGAAIGTPTYMSPEQARGEELDGRSDLYCLGVVFYELLTGVRPYTASDPFALALQHINAPLPKMPERLSFLQDMINRMMAKSADKRFQDAEELIAAIDRIFDQYDTEKIRVLLNDGFTDDSTQLWYKTLITDWRAHFTKQRLPLLIRQFARRRRKIVLASATALIVLLSATLLYLYQSDKAEQQRILQQSQYIEQLLSDGRRQLSRAQIFFPKGDNAFDTYMEIRELDPENEQARQPIDTLLDRIHTLALRTYENTDWNRTLALIENGLRLNPGHKRLLDLQLSARQAQEQAHQQKLEREREVRITELLARADQQMSDGRFVEPDGDNAVASLRAIEQLSPQDGRAAAGLQRVVTLMARQADQALELEQSDTAQTLITQGMDIAPEAAVLVALQQRLNQQRLELRIRQLLTQARELTAAKKFVTPADDNAWQRYQAVLEMDAENQPARQGIAALLKRIQELADQQRRADNPTGALQLIEQGLSIDPQAPALLALRHQTRQDQQVLELLAKAAEQLQQGRLNTPPGDNAAESFGEVLKLRSDHPGARAGMEKIATDFAGRASALLGQNDESASRSLIDQGLAILPDHPGLLQAQQRLALKIESRRRTEREVARLFQEAEVLSEQGKFSAPVDENAHARYQSILDLDSDNSAASKALEAIPERILTMARAAGQQGGAAYSVDLLEQGLSIAPDNGALQQAHSDALKQQQINNLLSRADTQISQGRLSEPADNSALATFQQLLELYPDNADGLAGLQRIADIYAGQAQEKLSQNQDEESLALLQSGLSINPEHPELVAIQQQLRQRQQRREALQQQQQEIRKLLDQASQQISRGQFSKPAESSALASYNAVLALQPDNSAARTGLVALPDAIYDRARQYSDDSKTTEALRLTDEGLVLMPEHPQLQSLKLQLLLQQRIDTLLQQAEQQLQAQQIRQPEGDNAVRTYRQILSLSADQPQALAALQRLADDHESRARSLLADNDNLLAREQTEAGLTIVADHQGLLAVMRELEQRRQAREAEALKQQQLQTLLAQARSESQRGALAGSLALISRGLALEPQHPELQALKRQVDRQQRILDLLELAEKQIRERRLTLPAGNNALATLQQVLELEPGHTQALAGIKWVADSYAELARERLENNQEDQSLRLIDKGLTVVADHPPLLELKQQIDRRRQLREQQRQQLQTIRRLLSQAQNQIKQGKFTTPATDNARSSYREILGISPTSPEALSGLAALPDAIHRLAQAQLNEGDPVSSRQRTEEGLQLDPQHPRLLALRKQLLLEQRIEQLLQQAQQHLDDGRLLLPENDSALGSYRQILDLQPQNPQALAGIERIADIRADQARQLLQQNRETESRALADRNLKLVPEHRPSLAVLEQLQQRQRQRQAEADRQQQLQNLLEEATAAQQAGALSDSLKHVRQALALAPEHPQALQLRQQLQQQLDQQQQINALLEQATGQLARKQLTLPSGSNAVDTFRRVLVLQPDHPGAIAGLTKIADTYAEMALTSIERSADAEAQQLVDRGLSVRSDHPLLLRLGEEIEARRAAAATRKRLIDRLSRLAQQQQQQGHYTRPPGNNAWESYRTILQFDPQNRNATEAIRRLSEELYQQASTARARGEIDESRGLTREGLTIAPNDQALLLLQQQLSEQLPSPQDDTAPLIDGVSSGDGGEDG